jgi:Rv0078B-related antitoxin
MPSRFQNIDVIDDRVAEILRQKSDAERLAMVDQMWCFARDMIRINLRRDHPDWTEEEVDRTDGAEAFAWSRMS